MYYDTQCGDGEQPTVEDLHGDAGAGILGCHEDPGAEMARHFRWDEPPTDGQMEADYAARCCEAEAARLAVRSGRAVVARAAAVRVVPTSTGRYVGVVESSSWTGRTLPQRSAELARQAALDLYEALDGPGRAA